MKKITYLIILLLAFNFGYGQTTLSAGDIVITGFNSDAPDQFSFVLLTDTTTGTTINFTDNGWFSTGGFRDNEGTLTWTSTSDLPCGSEIVISDNSPFSSSIGTVTEPNAGFNLATNGDQILAYQGPDATPVFLFAVHFDGTGWSTNATNPNTSAIPTGLTNGLNAIAINETDNAIYDCTTTSDNTAVLSAVSNSSNWTSSGTPLSIGGCFYSCAACAGGTVTWDGSSDTWSGTPDSTTQVIITGGNYDTSSVSGNQFSFSACSLLVDSGSSLNIADGDYIEVQNDITVNGTITVQPEGAVVQVDDTANVTENGSISVVKTTALLNNWYEYTYWSSPVSGETIDAGLFESETSRRYMFNGQNFLDHCAETANNNILVCDDGFGNGVQDDIDDDGNVWQWVNGATVMQPGIGYAATHSEAFFTGPPMSSPPYQFDYTFQGPFNNGVITVPIYRNDSETADNNWNLIGNPYPSAIDADLFLAANSAVAVDVDGTTYAGSGYTDGAIFLWSQDTDYSATSNGNQANNFSGSDYAIINGTGENAGGDGLTPNGFIPSGQAFFISMSNAATASLVSGDVYTANITFDNSMRVFGTTDNSQFFKNSNSKKSSTSLASKLWVDLTSDNGVFNQTLIGYINGASNNDDGSYFDAQKNSSAISSAILYTTIGGSSKKFAIQGKAENSLDKNEIIKLGFQTSIDIATLYTLSIAKLQGNFLSNNPIYLKDNLLNKVHNLTVCDYTFTSEVGEFNDRFEIVFNANALSTNDVSVEENQFRIVDLDNNRVQFNTNNDLSIKNIRVFDIIGRQLYNLNGNSSSETYTLSNLNNSVYIAKVELSNGANITKKAVKK